MIFLETPVSVSTRQRDSINSINRELSNGELTIHPVSIHDQKALQPATGNRNVVVSCVRLQSPLFMSVNRVFHPDLLPTEPGFQEFPLPEGLTQ